MKLHGPNIMPADEVVQYESERESKGYEGHDILFAVS